MKKDKYADVRGREIVYDSYDDYGILKFSIPCFVAGVDDNSISIHPIDKEEAIKLYAKGNKHSIKEERKLWKHPYDFIWCCRIDKMPTYGKQKHKKMLKILRSKAKSFKGKDLKIKSEGIPMGGMVSCPF